MAIKLRPNVKPFCSCHDACSDAGIKYENRQVDERELRNKVPEKKTRRFKFIAVFYTFIHFEMMKQCYVKSI